MREAQLPQKRRAGPGCSLPDIMASELVVRHPTGEEICRVNVEANVAWSDQSVVTADVLHLKRFLRERLGVPVDWQRLLVDTRELDNNQRLVELAPPGAAALELTLLKTLSDQEARERMLIVEWLRWASQGQIRGRSDDRAGVVIGEGGDANNIFRKHEATSWIQPGALVRLTADYLRELPPDVWQADFFNRLAILGCPLLERIPPEMGQFSKLVELEFADCPRLRALPREVGHLVDLERLSLHDCHDFPSLPAEIGSLHKLRDLSLIELSSLRSLPAEIGSLTSLQELVMAGLPWLRELPPELGQLRNLRHLGLEQCAALRTLPQEAGCLHNLWSVLVVGCGVKSLPRNLLLLLPLRNVVIFDNDPEMLQVIHPRGCAFAYRYGLHRKTRRVLRNGPVVHMSASGFDALRMVLSGNLWPPWRASSTTGVYFDIEAVALGEEAAASRLELRFPGSPGDAPLGRPPTASSLATAGSASSDDASIRTAGSAE